MLNLISDAWIPARRRDGSAGLIAPWQIAEDFGGPRAVVGLAAPRPDFNAALHEFLIGLLSAAFPLDHETWKKHLRRPPQAEELRTALGRFSPAFDLDGEGARFLQDFEDFVGTTAPVSALLIDSPGESTVRKNTDLFVKRDRVDCLCRSCTAQALHSLQTYAPSGGAGHRTSLRGGGPLTTLITLQAEKREELWFRLWPNLPDRDLAATPPDCDAALFPWLGKTRTSEKDSGVTTTPADCHALQAFWGMPRRIRLDFDAAGGACDLCGAQDDVLVRSYRTLPWGVNYDLWLHPLSPYYGDKKGGWLPRHAQPDGLTWRHWLALAENTRGQESRAALVVQLARGNRAEALKNLELRLAAFGYDMDNMKARNWHESEMPLHVIEDRNEREALETAEAALVRSAQVIGAAVVWQVKSALFPKPSEAKGDFGAIADAFWRGTEAEFHALAARAFDLIIGSEIDDLAAALLPLRQDWRVILERKALAIFDDEVPSLGFEEGEFKRIVDARRGLCWTLRGYGKQGTEFFTALGLPAPEQRKKKEKSAA